MSRSISDLSGKRFGKLTVLRFYGKKDGKHSQWLCRCDCGREIVVDRNNLKKQTSCKPCAIERQKQQYLSDSALYDVWAHMKQRCLNPKDQSYSRYGGRGITICDEWLESQAFCSWAVNNGYSPELTLDRIDNNAGYCPENCRWVDRKTQMNNRENTIFITAFGETLPCAEWARKTGIPKNTLRGRIKMGWSPERALTEAIHNRPTVGVHGL